MKNSIMKYGKCAMHRLLLRIHSHKDWDIDSYVNEILQMNIDDFYQENYEYGEYEIKKYVTVGAIFEDLNLSITDEEYIAMCDEMNYNYEEAKTNKYLNALINYSIMLEKVIDFFETNEVM